MQIFAAVKAAVTTREAVVFYGLRVPANGMICCPFHPDRHPSMKVDARYYCFGCHETGDVIDFVGRLFHLSPLDAARKIAADFGIDPRTPAAAAVQGNRMAQTRQRQAEAACMAILIDYECLLKEQKARYAPAPEDATWNPPSRRRCGSCPTFRISLTASMMRMHPCGAPPPRESPWTVPWRK